MRFKVILETIGGEKILPINYQYPLSAAIYRIISKGDVEYAQFLHDRGYGKGYKFFCFSDIRSPFSVKGDRIHLRNNIVEFKVAFHLPKAMKNFVQGLFASERIEIADNKTKQSFSVKTIEGIVNGVDNYLPKEFVNVALRPISALVVGVKNEKRHYDYLHPEDDKFIEMFTYNWREKIKTFYDQEVANDALLIVEKEYYPNPPKSRLITIKADTSAETKVRGFVNFKLRIQAERSYVDLLLNTGAGLYNAQGMGCMEVVNEIN